MATLNVSVTQSNVLLTSAVSSGSTLDFVIDNPIPYTSYFTLETVADNNGFYTNLTSKNTSGSFTLGAGQFGLVQSNYMASVVVSSGVTTLSFIPAVDIPANTLYLRGVGTGPYTTTSTSLVDADAQAFFDRVTAAGGTLSATEQTAVNTLVITMKADGTWTPMKAIYPMVGASAAACAQNLKSSSFTGTFSSGWTFASTGVTPNGTSAFFNTTLIPNTSLTLTSGHMSFYSRTNNNTGVYDMAAVGGATEQNLIVRYSNNNSYYCYGDTAQVQSIANTSGLGLFVTNRNSATNTTGYKNGSLVINGIQTSLLSTSQIFIGAAGSGGTATGFSTKQCAFASIGDGLTDTQASNFYTAVQAFQTTLSRQI
jgi:hypothetical protein